MKKTFTMSCEALALAALLFLSCENPASSAPEQTPSLTVQAGYNRLRVSWDPVEGADSWELRYGTDPAALEAYSGEIKGNTVILKNLRNGTDYFVQIRPRNAHGAGPWSEVVSATPAATGAVPEILTIEEGDGSLALSWDALWDAASYEVFYSAPNADPEILLKMKCLEEPEEGNIVINLDDYLYEYHVWVRARYDDGSAGDYSEEQTGRIEKHIATELYDLGLFLDEPHSVLSSSADRPYRIVLRDFYAGSVELRKLSDYTRGRYVSLDMGDLTDLWVTIFAPTPANRDKFVSIIFPRDIENIPDYCCASMRNLRYIELPPNLRRIGEYAFNGINSGFVFDGLPPTLEYIGNYGIDRLQYPGTTAVLPELNLGECAIAVLYNEAIDLSNVKSMTAESIGSNYAKVIIINRRSPPDIGVENYIMRHWNYENSPYRINAALDYYGWDYYPKVCEFHTPFRLGSRGVFIYVPEASLEAYQTAPGWKSFHNGPAAQINLTESGGWGTMAYSLEFGREPVFQSRYKPLSELPAEYQ
jgi:hypothetical protein